jgi:hypothetical protein
MDTIPWLVCSAGSEAETGCRARVLGVGLQFPAGDINMYMA